MATECEELRQVLVEEYGENNVEEIRRGAYRAHGWYFSTVVDMYEAWPEPESAADMFHSVLSSSPRDVIAAAGAIRAAGVWGKEQT